ncbi:hypothetical protein DFH07DRAFT_818143 [Mycena maculata]|uniref:F-box domain-containing protein n=1 Tax=Mycena maculata TaxID=230809 RepID=A0AAD7J7S8_9AGAR|nr:hypothetical protein DFH07DRAFT_818143 [Mycena maculata]
MDNTGAASAFGLLRLPNEVLLEIFQYLDPADPGIFGISTSCKRLHYLALPIFLSAWIPDAALPASRDLVLSPNQLEVLVPLQTSLFIHSLRNLSCSFSLNSARRDYSSRDMDIFFRNIRRLAGFLSILQRVDEVTLDFKDLNFWAIGESLDALETWSSVISALLDVVLEKDCRTLNVEGGMFIVHSSQFQRKPGPRATVQRRSVMFDVGRRISSAFVARPDVQKVTPDPGKPRVGLRTFNIHSRVLLLHPCYTWTMAALNTSPNLLSLSIVRVDIPERSWDEILSSIHVPTLEDLSIDLRCRIRAASFDQFLARHPRIYNLNLGRDLLPLPENDAASKDCLPNLRNLSASASYVRFLMVDKRAPAVRALRLLVKVASHAIFKVADINYMLAPCHARMGGIHLTLAITVDYASSHWTGFFPDEDSTAAPKRRVPDSLRSAQALELVSTCASDAFENLALRWLPSFPLLRSVSFSGCLNKHLDPVSFVFRVREACPDIELVTIDGKRFDAVP